MLDAETKRERKKEHMRSVRHNKMPIEKRVKLILKKALLPDPHERKS